MKRGRGSCEAWRRMKKDEGGSNNYLHLLPIDRFGLILHKVKVLRFLEHLPVVMESYLWTPLLPTGHSVPCPTLLSSSTRTGLNDRFDCLFQSRFILLVLAWFQLVNCMSSLHCFLINRLSLRLNWRLVRDIRNLACINAGKWFHQKYEGVQKNFAWLAKMECDSVYNQGPGIKEIWF